MAELNSLQNIGKEYERKLKSVGIATAEELKEIGSEEAFLRVKLRYENVCLVHLYALEGAVTDMKYNQLSEDTKKRLKAFHDKLK